MELVTDEIDWHSILSEYGLAHKTAITENTLSQEVWDWCETNNIKVEYEGTIDDHHDIWYIPNEEQLMWFRLRWE
jgi:hypothetical protein